MPLPRIVADAFGVVTISLVSIFIILSLVCVSYLIYFRSRTRRQGFHQFGYFNGPWITRIALVLVAIWWACGEILRLTLLKGEGRVFVSDKWQHGICKFYIISNIGFAEPCLFLILVLLLHASLKDFGALNKRWNARTIGYVLLFCIPNFLVQVILVLIAPKLVEGKPNGAKINKYFTSTSSLIDGGSGKQMACTYPLLNTIILGLFHSVIIAYISCIGYYMASSVINKGLQRRIYVIYISVTTFLTLRVLILGLSVYPKPGGLAFETLVFLAFLALLLVAAVVVCIVVYFPVADALALGNLGQMDLEEILPFDDYYGGASSMINQNHLELARNSDASTKRGSISFRTMIKDDMLPLSDAFYDATVFHPGNNQGMPSNSVASPTFSGRPQGIQLRGVPES